MRKCCVAIASWVWKYFALVLLLANDRLWGYFWPMIDFGVTVARCVLIVSLFFFHATCVVFQGNSEELT